jgi:hypothetical protein
VTGLSQRQSDILNIARAFGSVVWCFDTGILREKT